MFNLERKEKFIILFLLAALLIGIAFRAQKNPARIIDVKSGSFDAEGAAGGLEKVNINEADEALLAALDGIGPALARRIIAYRDEKGRFASIDDLKKVKGIGEKLFQKIKDEVSAE